MDRGVDFTSSSLSGATLKAHGYQFCCRYLAPESWKRLTLAEAKEKTAAGIRIVSNYEDTAHPSDTFAQGVHDATLAKAQHTQFGGPDWAPIYFSIDSDVSPTGYKNYFKGVISVIGVARSGCYGEEALIKNLFEAGLLGQNDSGVPYGWRSMSTAFPGGTSTVDIAVYQKGSGTVSGFSVDFDYALTSGYGGWLIGEADPNMALPVDVWKEDIIPNPAVRADSPKHTPPGNNPTTQAAFALGDVWDRVAKLQAAVDALSVKLDKLLAK